MNENLYHSKPIDLANIKSILIQTLNPFYADAIWLAALAKYWGENMEFGNMQ